MKISDSQKIRMGVLCMIWIISGFVLKIPFPIIVVMTALIILLCAGNFFQKISVAFVGVFMVWAVAVTFATLPNYKDVRENGLDTVELQSKATDLTAMAKETLNYEKDTSLSVKLENLNAAHEQGLLTQVEYEEMKVKLLEDFVTEE